MVHTCFMAGSEKLFGMSGVARKSTTAKSPDIKWKWCPAFVCRQREVKRAVLSRAANLWSYLQDKSIAVSESRAAYAGREPEGLPLACCPPGPSWGVPACLFTLHLFCFSARILQLLAHIQRQACNKPTYPLKQASYTIKVNRESELSEMLQCKCRHI